MACSAVAVPSLRPRSTIPARSSPARVIYWLLGALTSVVRATGRVALLAYVYIGAEVLHFALVPLLVFGAGPIPALGVAGAGIATVTSFAASSLVLACYLASGRSSVTLSFRGVRFAARDVRRDPEGRRADVDAAAVQQHRACGDHRLCRPARHDGAGRLRHRRAAGVPALSDQLRAWRRRAGHGRHQHRRPPVRTRRPHRLDRHRPVGRRDVAGRRDRHHRARPVEWPVHRRSGDPPRHRDLSRHRRHGLHLHRPQYADVGLPVDSPAAVPAARRAVAAGRGRDRRLDRHSSCSTRAWSASASSPSPAWSCMGSVLSLAFLLYANLGPREAT